MSYAIKTQATNGTVTISGSNAIYTPSAGYVGNDSFTFCAIDDDGALSEIATKTVTVEDDIDPKDTTCAEPVLEYDKDPVTGQITVSATSNNTTPMTLVFEDPSYPDIVIPAGDTQTFPFKHPLCWVYTCP